MLWQPIITNLTALLWTASDFVIGIRHGYCNVGDVSFIRLLFGVFWADLKIAPEKAQYHVSFVYYIFSMLIPSQVAAYGDSKVFSGGNCVYKMTVNIVSALERASLSVDKQTFCFQDGTSISQLLSQAVARSRSCCSCSWSLHLDTTLYNAVSSANNLVDAVKVSYGSLM